MAAAGACASPELRVTEIDVGAAIVANEDEAALKPLAIAAMSGGGSRVAWMGGDGKVHVTTLDAEDHVKSGGLSLAIDANDFGDL
jgi:hypothetical protein